MERTTLPTDLHVQGRATFGSITLPASAVTNASVASDAAIAAEKLEHQLRIPYAQEATANATAEERIIHIARGDGSIEEFIAGLITPPDTALAGGRSAVVDLKKNGTTILTNPITLSSTSVAGTPDTMTISGAGTYTTSDRFTVAITLGGGSTGTHAKGVYGIGIFNEVG